MNAVEKLLRFSLRNTLAFGLLSLLWCGAAVWIYFSLPISLLPNLNFPVLNVSIEMPGLTAEEMEKQAALPMESALSGIANVRRVRSTSVANLSLVTVQMNWGADLEMARQQVLQKMNGAQSGLPAGARVSLESLSGTLGQIQGFVISGGASLADLYEFVNVKLKPLLLQQAGVFEVLTFGGMAKEYAVFVKPSRLQQFDLTLKDVQDALIRNNVTSAGGMLDFGSQSFAIVAQTQLTDVQSIENVIIAVKNNVPVRVQDVARVTIDHMPYRGGAERGTTPGLVVEIVKQPDADTVGVARRVQALVDVFSAQLPQNVRIEKFYDQSELVLDSIHGVEEAVLLGAALVALILLCFLRSWRAALVAFASIPTSLLSALIFMKMFGMSLNIMTLSAIALATGLVIDDAIVVIENVFRHRELKPQAPIGELFIEAAMEVAGPVASSTITTIAIFAPLVFLSGLAGRLFAPVGVVVSVVMLASLFFAFTLIPSVGPRLMTDAPPRRSRSRMAALYERTLTRALNMKAPLIALTVAACVASLYLLTRLNREFLPLLDEGSVLMTVETPPGSSLQETLRVTRLLVNDVFNDPDVETTVSQTGHAPGTQDTDTMNHSDVTAKLVPRARRRKSVDELFALFRKRAENYPGVLVDFTMPLQDKLNDAIGGVSRTIGINIFSEDLAALQSAAQNVAARMVKIPGVVDLNPGSIAPVPAVVLSLRAAEANALGVTHEDVNNVLEAMSYGMAATPVRELHKQVPLVVRIEGTDDNLPTLHKSQLEKTPVRTANGSYVPLSQVADIRFADVPSRIDHEHAARFVTVSCNVEHAKNQSVIRAMQEILAKMSWPAGMTYEISGSYVAQAETTRSLLGIGAMALVLVGAILWIEFNSLRKTLLVLLTIPLSTLGAGVALWLTRQTLNISSLIGIVMLVGIVLRNGIVLIDYIQLSVERGEQLDRAIVLGAQVRLRPILMTALSEILGLAPLACGLGAGSALERPLAIAVIGGLATSTLLTLYVLPAAYQIFIRNVQK
jgi:CzcA family heavy metal efflux pump